MRQWYDLPTPEQREAAWIAGESWGLVRNLRAAREVIRRNDPPLALLLDTLHPLPPCPHKPRQDRTPYGSLPRWSCKGCGVEMRSGPLNNWRAVSPPARETSPKPNSGQPS